MERLTVRSRIRDPSDLRIGDRDVTRSGESLRRIDEPTALHQERIAIRSATALRMGDLLREVACETDNKRSDRLPDESSARVHPEGTFRCWIILCLSCQARCKCPDCMRTGTVGRLETPGTPVPVRTREPTVSAAGGRAL